MVVGNRVRECQRSGKKKIDGETCVRREIRSGRDSGRERKRPREIKRLGVKRLRGDRVKKKTEMRQKPAERQGSMEREVEETEKRRNGDKGKQKRVGTVAGRVR